VVDQTGLPLPGVTVQIFASDRLLQTLTTEADGFFTLPQVPTDATLILSLEGFETTHTAAANVPDHIVMPLARATDSTVVVAPETIDASPSAERLGSTLTTTAIARLPSAHMHARESLPLLPSVIRGADGLMQLGGARAYQTPLTLDGFNVTDPATGLSSLNLPLESVGAIEALRDPMSVVAGGLLGGVIRLESKSGGTTRAGGVQGFVPRPRFSTPGFGRLEGIFPRAHIAGSAADERVRYTLAAEYDYERIPVPEVTDKTGRDLIEASGIVFGRIDAQVNTANSVTFEAFSFPSATRSFGLSPRRDSEAAVDLSAHDRFAGLTLRHFFSSSAVFTLRLGTFARWAKVLPKGSGASTLTPVGWAGNWFSSVTRRAARQMVSATWDRTLKVGRWPHRVTLADELSVRRMTGHVSEGAIEVTNAEGKLVRAVSFGSAASINARDWSTGAIARDVWSVSDRLELDSGIRVDYQTGDAAQPSARVGVRYGIDASGRTTLRGGFGTFVGTVPLGAFAFNAYPTRTDRFYDSESGALTGELTFQPSIGRLQFPQARTVVAGIERALTDGLDGQVVFTDRQSHHIATLTVPAENGAIRVESVGSGHYRELQVSVRRTWPHDQVLFVSYVRSQAVGELNEFAAMFQAMDAPLIQPGGRARTSNDARNRLLTWGTFNLPYRIVVSPVTEWRSGFPFSALTSRYMYAGAPQKQSFPAFMATDIVTYKTVTVKGRTADVGMQIFNLTNHRNPRDVFPVAGLPRFGQFVNSVGPIVRGYLLLKW